MTDVSPNAQPAAISPSPFSLAGQHILVTGAGRGLGQAMALEVAAAGAHVSLVARSQHQLDETSAAIAGAGGSSTALPCDLSDTGVVAQLVEDAEAVSPLDGVIHAAGVQLRKPAVELTIEDWRYVQAVNVEAPFFLSTEVGRRQLKSGRCGSHVFVASLASTIGLPGVAPYVASKSAIGGIARALSREWAEHGIRVNAIAPGYFRTQLTEGLLDQPADQARILSRIPLGRLGERGELGGAAVFLLSDASSYMTGQLLNLDGGWLAA